MLKPLVSVVITTKNEERNIENCLISIKEQCYRNIEIIVVDNFSEDRTMALAFKYTDKVYEKGPERSFQRNYGIFEVASGKYTLFVDADMILSPCLVACCVERMESRSRGQFSIAALHISEIVLGNSYWSKVRRFERTFYDGTVIDGARFFLRDAFKQVGGFDLNMSGPEDWDIDKKIKRIGAIELMDKKTSTGCNINKWPLYNFIKQQGADPRNYGCVIYHNESAFNLKRYLAKKAYYTKSFDAYITKWGKDDPDIKRQFGLWYRYFKVFLEHGKWNNFFSKPHYVFGMYWLRLLVGVKFLMRKTV